MRSIACRGVSRRAALRAGRPACAMVGAGVEDRAGPDVCRPTSPGRAGTPRSAPASKTLERWCSSRTASAKAARRMSWPPTTNWPESSRSRPSKSGKAVTRLVGPIKPAAQGRQAEGRGVPTPPQAPINHSRRDVDSLRMIFHRGRAQGIQTAASRGRARPDAAGMRGIQAILAIVAGLGQAAGIGCKVNWQPEDRHSDDRLLRFASPR